MRILAICIAVSSALSAAASAAAGAAPDFRRDIQPILQRSCLKCHGDQAQGGVRLDSRDAALKSAGGKAIVAHNSAASELIRRVTAEKDEMRMPPVYSGLQRLSAAEVAALKAWIDAGPSWGTEDHITASAEMNWSLKPIIRPHPPEPGNPIDAFVRSRLARSALTPSPPADRRTLLRRVYFDLIGLPPTPTELADFIKDARPDAYERVVDRLLASPRYGERWARHWLDTVHYADSHGFEHDIGRDNGWPYRDYVIQALNKDLPWSRFVREQLAADYIYPDQPDLTPALGFLGAGNFDLSAYNTAPRNFENIDRDDLVTQTMTAFCSVTANCARCHDHKFDPIPQADYYALQAVFAGLTKGDRLYDASTKAAADRARWQTMLEGAQKQDAALLDSAEAASRVKAWLAEARHPGDWTQPHIDSVTSAQGSTLTVMPDGSVSSGGIRPETDTYTTALRLPAGRVTAVRLDLLSSAALPHGGPGRQDNGNMHLTEIEVLRQDAGGKPTPIKLSTASADFNQEGWEVSKAIDGDRNTAWGIYPQVGHAHYAVFTFAEPQTVTTASQLVVKMHQDHGGGHIIGLYRLSLSGAPAATLGAVPQEVDEALNTPEAARSAQQKRSIAAYVLKTTAEEELAKLPAPMRVFAAGANVDVPTVGRVVMTAPRKIFVLERGDIDKPREAALPGALTAVKALNSRFTLSNANDEAARRAALAEWIVDRNNPLTWRSVVNRVWQYHFGRGICDTPNDLGKMGGVRSHPELLDWLAAWFRDDAKGSLKQLHRLIVTSQTYRQASANRPECARLDTDNRLLWRQNRLRLDAESYRDFAHAVSGTLDLTMGGPGVKNFIASPGPQLTPALDYKAYDWSSAGAGRRSIYRVVWRGIPDPFMDALDFPDLGLLAPTRSFSVSALQALQLYNNSFVLYCSRKLGDEAARDHPLLPDQVTDVVRRVWLRTPTPAEMAAMTSLVRQDGLAELCRVLFNSNEFLFVD